MVPVQTAVNAPTIQMRLESMGRRPCIPVRAAAREMVKMYEGLRNAWTAVMPPIKPGCPAATAPMLASGWKLLSPDGQGMP